MEAERLIHSYFRAKNYKASENTLKSELKSIFKADASQNISWNICLPAMTELFKSIHDSNQEDQYFITFKLLRLWVDSSLDFYQNDLRKAMGPIFIHMYLVMVRRDMQEAAENFFKDYSVYHWSQSDLDKLGKIRSEEEIPKIFNEKYEISMQHYSFSQLMHFVETEDLVIVLSILNKNLKINLTNHGSQTVLLGKELKIQNSRANLLLEENSKTQKIPLPLTTGITEQRVSESQGKVDLKENFPNVICHTIRNANEAVCIDITEDSSLIACGFDDSVIRLYEVYSTLIMKELIGHSGAVFSVSFAPDKNLLVSGSEDCMVRLWSLISFSCLAEFSSHTSPVWTVKFSPFGYYFASGGNDKVTYLWATPWTKPLKMLVGHYSDIVSLAFHYKCTYIATGSADKTVRVWDILTGECVRIFAGPVGCINSIVFSRNGKMLLAGDSNGDIICWDINKKETIWIVKAIGDVNCIGLCQDDQLVLVGTNQKAVYSINMQGKVLTEFRSKVEVICITFSYKNLGIACGIVRINLDT